MLSEMRGEFRVDLCDHDNEIIVVADLPVAEKEDVSISLVNPGKLEIRSERSTYNEGKEEGYCIRERMSGTMSRIVPLLHEAPNE